MLVFCEMKITLDDFLGGKIRLCQPAKGYRAGLDAILLAAFVKAKDQAKILDVGAGVGAVSLSMAYHLPNTFITALEIQHDLVKLAHQNTLLNGFGDRVVPLEGDLFSSSANIVPNSFDCVVTNPPYFDYGDSAKGRDALKADSRHLKTISIVEWVKACLRYVKPRGYFSLIYRASELDQILCALKPIMGEVTICPLWPAKGHEAKLVLVRARKGTKTGSKITAGYTLHEEDGSYTQMIENILRGNACF